MARLQLDAAQRDGQRPLCRRPARSHERPPRRAGEGRWLGDPGLRPRRPARGGRRICLGGQDQFVADGRGQRPDDADRRSRQDGRLRRRHVCVGRKAVGDLGRGIRLPAARHARSCHRRIPAGRTRAQVGRERLRDQRRRAHGRLCRQRGGRRPAQAIRRGERPRAACAHARRGDRRTRLVQRRPAGLQPRLRRLTDRRLRARPT